MSFGTFSVLRHHALFLACGFALRALIELFQAARASSGVRRDRAIATAAKKNLGRFENTGVGALCTHRQLFERSAAVRTEIGPYRAAVRAERFPSALLTLLNDHSLRVFLTESDATRA